MPRPTNVARVVVSGTLSGGESFAWGFWLDAAAASAADAQTQVNAIASEFATHLKTQACGMIRTGDSYDKVTYYSYATATGPAEFVAEAAITSGAGTGTGATLPLQCSMVITLRTAMAGRRHRGRMYLPLTNRALTASQQTQGQIDSVRSDVHDFLAAVNTSTSINGVVSIISQVAGEKVPVNQVTADSRVDIQRRRAASEAELYQSSQAL